MKTVSLIIATAFAVLFVGCAKEDIQDNSPSSDPSAKVVSLKNLFVTPQFVEYYTKAEEAFKANNVDSRAAFIDPFFTSDGFGIAQNLEFDFSGPFPMIVGGQGAFFNATLDGNDFYRQNNDGTVSVHITSNRANVEHIDFGTLQSLTTNRGNLTMNYSGPVVSFDITDEFGNVIFTIMFIDMSAGNNAVSFHGNGRVGENGAAPYQNLVARWVTPAGNGTPDVGFTLN